MRPAPLTKKTDIAEALTMDYFSTLIAALPGTCAQGLIWGIMAIGVYITFKVLDMADMTVDGTMCTGGAVCIVMMLNGYSVWIALLCSVCAGMLAGLVSGLLHTLMGIPSILAGILTQLALYSVNLRILGSSNKPISVRFYDLLVSLMYIKEALIVAAVIVVVVIALLYIFFGTELGCAMRATGNNQAMASAQGINTNFIKVLGLMLSNGIVALCSGILAQYQGFADVNMGRGAIVIGLAAVIIGEVVFGKIFKNFALRLLGVALGAIIYYLVIQAVLLTKIINTDDLKMLTAMVVAVFLSIPYLKNKYLSGSKRKAVH